MKNKIETSEMTTKEMQESLKLLKQGIKEKKIAYEHANPIEQNCWISSSGIMGIYFPNSVLKDLTKDSNKYYHICALSKVGKELGIMFALNDDVEDKLMEYFKPYKFISFDMFLYGQHYRAIKHGIIMDIDLSQEYLTKLQQVKRITKKDGKDFQDVCKNFVGGCGVWLHFDCLGRVCNSINVNGVRLWREDQQREVEDIPSANEIDALIKSAINDYKDTIKTYSLDLARLPKTFREFERIAATLKAFKKDLRHWVYFAKELDYMIV